MKRIEGNKLVALIISAGMVTTFLAACTVNTDQLGQGINNLGNAFAATTEAPKPAETEVTETEVTTAKVSGESVTDTTATEETSASGETSTSGETSATDETTTTEETTTTDTSATASDPVTTPAAGQRVDFSKVVEKDLTDSFAVTSEEFGESAYTDDENEVLLAKFEGTRFVVTKASSENIMSSINLIINGFYKEAEGAYNRMLAKARAEYNLNGVIENPYTVTCDFIYTTNARSLSVLMVYEVSGGKNVKSTVIDFASFDMLTGQYITCNSICKDPEGFEKALKSGLANSLKIQPKPNTGDAEETKKPAPIPTEKDFTAVYVAPGPATTDPSANSFATIYGVVGNKVYSAVIDMNAYGGFLNRYGSSLFFA